MKTSLILPLCLLSSPLLAAGVYEIDRSQWEKPPAASAQKPAAQRNTHTTHTHTPSTPAATSQPSTPVEESTAPQGDVAQTCQPGHPCSELQ